MVRENEQKTFERILKKNLTLISWIYMIIGAIIQFGPKTSFHVFQLLFQ